MSPLISFGSKDCAVLIFLKKTLLERSGGIYRFQLGAWYPPSVGSVGAYGGYNSLMHLNEGLKRCKSSFLSLLVRKQLTQSLAMFMD